MASTEQPSARPTVLDEKHAGPTHASPEVNGAAHEQGEQFQDPEKAAEHTYARSKESKEDDAPKQDDKAEGNHKQPDTNGDKAQSSQPSDGKHDGDDDKSKPSGHESLPKRAESELGEIKDKLTESKRKIKDKAHPPGGFDTSPLPDVPPGYTLKITFHGASDLPAADVESASSDPFLHATITTSLPKRHEDDPLLTHRTRTIHKTTNPRWEEEWVVANIPASGFSLKCRLYDEDSSDHDDRLGNVTIEVPHLEENWEGIGTHNKTAAPINRETNDKEDEEGWAGQTYDVKKRSGSKRAYLFRAIHTGISRNLKMTPQLHISIEMVGKSEGPGAQSYTVGPTRWIKHYSPMIGRIAGTRVNKDEEHDAEPNQDDPEADKRNTKKYE
jgi:hypothetical protein